MELGKDRSSEAKSGVPKFDPDLHRWLTAAGAVAALLVALAQCSGLMPAQKPPLMSQSHASTASGPAK